MNTQELADRLANDAMISKSEAMRIIKCTFKIIRECEDDVSIKDFGRFGTAVRAARIGRNPRTGEPVQIKQRRAPTFSASKALKDAKNVI